eukprot:TRINITY_DN9647_c0_g1_i2.p2 TRINITY_DN9647_c0_g1~~TRINITY_DN9647_c0_g1_i2.p2  ORF type:complete len:381 (-),score=132.94 TRINITY_DN9647_c0_g1_i2:1698-2840(-)
MSTKVYQCTQCKAENFAWRDTCFKCKKWATGSEETYWKKRSASGKRRENKEKAKGDLDMDKIAQKVVELMAKKDGDQQDGPSVESANEPSKPTKPSQAPTRKNGNQGDTKNAKDPPKVSIDTTLLKKEEKEAYDKTQKSIRTKQKMLEDLLKEGEENDSATVLSLKGDILNLEEKLEGMRPMEQKISQQTQALKDMRARKDEIEIQVKSLREEHRQLELQIAANKRELDEMQDQFHVERQQEAAPTVQLNAAAIQLAIARKDREMYKLLTGLELKTEEAGQGDEGRNREEDNNGGGRSGIGAGRGAASSLPSLGAPSASLPSSTPAAAATGLFVPQVNKTKRQVESGSLGPSAKRSSSAPRQARSRSPLFQEPPPEQPQQ